MLPRPAWGGGGPRDWPRTVFGLAIKRTDYYKLLLQWSGRVVGPSSAEAHFQKFIIFFFENFGEILETSYGIFVQNVCFLGSGGWVDK